MSTAWVMIVQMYASMVVVPGNYPTFEACKEAAYQAQTFDALYEPKSIFMRALSVTCVPVPKETIK